MENASKALIMAASVLLGVMIISFAVYLFSTFGIYFAYEDGNLGAHALFRSSGYGHSIANHMSPVVSFGDNIIIKSGDDTINNPYTNGK